MDVDSTAKLIEATAKLVGVAIWPAAVGYVLVRFGSNIGNFISDLGEMTLKGVGFEASVKRRQKEAGAALVAATISQGGRRNTGKPRKMQLRKFVQAVKGANARILRRIEGSRVLWVDDRPGNNNYERHALEALGIKFVISTSTDDALVKLKVQHFDGIISDMGRPPDAQAGYTLLDKLRSSGNQIPFIIYASSRSPEHQAEARRRGAVGCTACYRTF